MSMVQSIITAQRQVTIPVSTMRQFGLAPGEVITWTVRDGRLILERTGHYSLDDVRAALALPKGAHETDRELRAGLKAWIRAKHEAG